MRSLQHPGTDAIALTQVLYALSDPVRLEIVKELENGRERCCGDFEIPNVTKSTLSHHFKVLREAGLIKTRTEGRNRFSSLRREDLEARFPGLIESVLRARSISGEGSESQKPKSQEQSIRA